MRAYVLLVLALVSAGCTSGEGLGALTGRDAARDPLYEEHRAAVSGQHDQEYPFAVEPGATVANVTLRLENWKHGLPLPGQAPAQLTLALLDASGAALDSVVLDGDHPVASLLATMPAPGTYLARVSGFGVSQELEGDEYGAGYALSVEVLYE